MMRAGGTARILENLQRNDQLAFLMSLVSITQFPYVLK